VIADAEARRICDAGDWRRQRPNATLAVAFLAHIFVVLMSPSWMDWGSVLAAIKADPEGLRRALAAA